MLVRQKDSEFKIPSKKVKCSRCDGECLAEESVKGIVVYRCISCARIEKSEQYNKN